ncbi:hypothetical protein KBA27_05340 [bacterium]|nr:hypothetical protein [bacterium]
MSFEIGNFGTKKSSNPFLNGIQKKQQEENSVAYMGNPMQAINSIFTHGGASHGTQTHDSAVRA